MGKQALVSNLHLTTPGPACEMGQEPIKAIGASALGIKQA